MPSLMHEWSLRAALGRPELWLAALMPHTPAPVDLVPVAGSGVTATVMAPTGSPKAGAPSGPRPQGVSVMWDLTALAREAKADDDEDRIRQPNLRQHDIDLLFGRLP